MCCMVRYCIIMLIICQHVIITLSTYHVLLSNNMPTCALYFDKFVMPIRVGIEHFRALGWSSLVTTGPMYATFLKPSRISSIMSWPINNTESDETLAIKCHSSTTMFQHYCIVKKLLMLPQKIISLHNPPKT